MADGDDVLSGLEAAAEPPETGPSVSESAAAAFDNLRQEPEGEKALDRARDEGGRFAPKPAEQAEQDAKPVPEAPQPPQMPASWGKERAALWGGMSPEAQAYAVEREAQMAEGVKRFEGLAKFDEAAQANGTSLAEVLGRVQHLENAFGANPVQGYHMLCENLGIDPQKLAAAILGKPSAEPSKDAPEQAAQIDPALQARLDRLEAAHQASARDRHEQVQRENATRVAEFAKANEHFEEVAEEVASLIRGARLQGRDLSLQDAYDRAVWSVPGVREKIVAKQSAEAEAKRISDAHKAATAAKNASRSLKGTSNGSQPGTAPKSVREAAADAFDRLSG